ncbi:MAG: tyrosine-type recombinase/integrase [Anaerolineae bacterium]|nr:tyrosine-type recombinase/integrase [Anaerolineae bacterium]
MDTRQLPLFPTQPASEADLNASTRLQDTVMLFQQRLARDGKSEHTVGAFTSDLHLLQEFLGGGQRLGAIMTADLNAFLHWLEYERGVPCSRKSYARRVTTLKVYFKWLHEMAAIPTDPAVAVMQRSGPAPLALILTPDQVMAVQGVALTLRSGRKPDARPALLLELLLATGIKKSETMRLLPEDIDQAGPTPVLHVRKGAAKDVYRERRLPLDAAILPLLDQYLWQYEPKTVLFTCTARNLEYILEHLGDEAEVPHKISFEMMRWTSAVRDYQAGKDPNEIREKLGLSRISWTETFRKIRQLSGEAAEPAGGQAAS